MGYYIQTAGPRDKAAYIIREYGAMQWPKAPKWEDVPEDLAIICVVDNGVFEAAGFAYSKEELDEFDAPNERPRRPRTWLLMPRDVAEQLTKFRR